MKRIGNSIDYRETGRHVINNVSERYFYKYFAEQEDEFIKVLYLSSYEICNVYTDKNTPLSAYLKTKGEKATFPVVFDSKETRLNEQYAESVLKQVVYNNQFNCHGLTFLDKKFWFELNNETSEIILTEDNYVECQFSDLKENGIALYYLPSGRLYHSARILNGILISKFGINNLVTFGEDEIKEYYPRLDFSLTRYFNR